MSYGFFDTFYGCRIENVCRESEGVKKPKSEFD